MLARLCSKSFKLGFSHTLIKNFQMYKLDLEKAEEPEIKLPRVVGSLRNQGNSRNTSINTSAWLTTKPFNMWITTNWKILRDGSIRLPYLSTEKLVMLVRKQQLKPDMEKWTCSRLRKENDKSVYCHPVYLFIFILFIFIVVNFVVHWNETAMGLHVFPILIPPSHLPLHPIPLGLPSAPGPSACLMHPTWAGDLFHPR